MITINRSHIKIALIDSETRNFYYIKPTLLNMQARSSGKAHNTMSAFSVGATVDPEIETDDPEIETDDPEIETDDPEIETDDPEIETDDPEIETKDPSTKIEGFAEDDDFDDFSDDDIEEMTPEPPEADVARLYRLGRAPNFADLAVEDLHYWSTLIQTFAESEPEFYDKFMRYIPINQEYCAYERAFKVNDDDAMFALIFRHQLLQKMVRKGS
jgi:hypothetical protein